MTSTPGNASPRAVDRGFVRPVADADEKRPLVEPNRVAALDESRVVERGCDRNAGVRQRACDRVRLSSSPLLARPQQDRPAAPTSTGS